PPPLPRLENGPRATSGPPRRGRRRSPRGATRRRVPAAPERGAARHARDRRHARAAPVSAAAARRAATRRRAPRTRGARALRRRLRAAGRGEPGAADGGGILEPRSARRAHGRGSAERAGGALRCTLLARFRYVRLGYQERGLRFYPEPRGDGVLVPVSYYTDFLQRYVGPEECARLLARFCRWAEATSVLAVPCFHPCLWPEPLARFL